ncbi:SgcJ/EcaC family oxidoreductase [Kitasatospora xanthocidica]|uniref:SgcJ/EcaC family oxidoreductase n=1 Tax=Kitasatospora xanthocidica TaxID=83382 RepID=UPI0036E58E99
MRSENESAVRAVLGELYEAWAAGDADAMTACYLEDATSALPGSLSDGRTAVRDRMASAFAGPLKGSRVVDEVHSVRFPTVDVALVVSRSAIVPAGEAEPAEGSWVIATWTLARRDGDWRVAAYHNCAA